MGRVREKCVLGFPGLLNLVHRLRWWTMVFFRKSSAFYFDIFRNMPIISNRFHTRTQCELKGWFVGNLYR